MPHGTPDWGVDWIPRTVWGLEDLGEHAARLGSPHLWDRRGDVIIQDSFEHGLGQCGRLGSGANWAVRLEGGYAWRGAFSAKLITGDEKGNYARIRYVHGLPVDSRLGLEFTFSPHANTRTIYWTIIRNDGTGAIRAPVWYEFQNDLLWCRNGDAPHVNFGTDVNLSDEMWHTGKLVADFGVTPRRYVRFILNNQEWDLTPYALQAIIGGPQQETYWDIHHYTNVDANIAAYVDNVIVTQNEP